MCQGWLINKHTGVAEPDWKGTNKKNTKSTGLKSFHMTDSSKRAAEEDVQESLLPASKRCAIERTTDENQNVQAKSPDGNVVREQSKEKVQAEEDTETVGGSPEEGNKLQHDEVIPMKTSKRGTAGKTDGLDSEAGDNTVSLGQSAQTSMTRKSDQKDDAQRRLPLVGPERSPALDLNPNESEAGGNDVRTDPLSKSNQSDQKGDAEKEKTDVPLDDEESESDIEENCSDYEMPGDIDSFTSERRANKRVRYQKRLTLRSSPPPLYKLEGNIEVVNKFEEWARSQYKGKDYPSTHSSHLFKRRDEKSLLALMTKEHGSDFRLKNLTQFIPGEGELYVLPIDARKFVFADEDHTEDYTASYQQSLLKAYQMLIKFLTSQANTIVPQNVSDQVMLNSRILSLDRLNTEKTKDKIWTDITRRIDAHAGKVAAAQSVIDPEWEDGVRNLVHSWNQSKELEAMMEDIYAMHNKYAGNSEELMSDKDYDRFVGNVHGMTSLQNYGRAAQAGSIKNKDWRGKKKIIGVGVNIKLAVEEDRFHKTGRTQNFFITESQVEVVKLYWDIKRKFFAGKKLEASVWDANSPFFCSAKGKAIKKPRDAFMGNVAKGSNLPKVTTNTVRSSASTLLLRNADTAADEPRAMDHSINTAIKHYDKSGEEVTVKLKSFLAEVNGNRPMPDHVLANRPELLEMRQAIEEEEQAMAMEEARAYQKAAKKHQSDKVSMAKVGFVNISSVHDSFM